LQGVRYANIGIAVAVAFAIVGVLIFRESSEAATQAIALIGLFIGLAVSEGLNGRAKRREEKRAQ
jgi:hypothetical protein